MRPSHCICLANAPADPPHPALKKLSLTQELLYYLSTRGWEDSVVVPLGAAEPHLTSPYQGEGSEARLHLSQIVEQTVTKPLLVKERCRRR